MDRTLFAEVHGLTSRPRLTLGVRPRALPLSSPFPFPSLLRARVKTVVRSAIYSTPNLFKLGSREREIDFPVKYLPKVGQNGAQEPTPTICSSQS